MISHIVYANFTQFKFCSSLQDAMAYVDLFGDGRIFVPMDLQLQAENDRLRKTLGQWLEYMEWLQDNCENHELRPEHLDDLEERTKALQEGRDTQGGGQ